MAGLDNFMLGEAIPVDFRDIWRRHLSDLSPFCIDLKRNQVVFVRVASDVDLTAAPFYYHAQRQHAIEVYSLGFEQFYELAEELPDDAGNVGFLFSTGRCGSTLLAKLLQTSPQVVAISEPDVYTQAVVSGLSQDEAAKLIRCCTRVLSTVHRRRVPAASFVFIKLRSQCVYRGEVFRHADHRYRSLFLYRNATDVVNSFYSLLPGWGRAVVRRVPVDHWYLSGAQMRLRISKICPLLSDKRFADLPRSCFNICVLMWLSAMESAARLQAGDEPFFQSILRYDDLLLQRHSIVATLFKRWCVAPPDAQMLEAVFERNSQSESGIRSRGLWVLRQQDEESLRSILARHPLVRVPEHDLKRSFSGTA